MKASESLQNDQSTASENALRRAVDTTPAFIHTARPDGYLDYFNRGWLDFLGKSLDDVCGWRWTESVHPEDVAALIQKWHDALASGEPFEIEARVRRADGSYRAFLHRKLPLRDEHGNIVKWFGSSLDIEDRKCAEQRIAEKTSQLERSEFYLREGERLAHMGSWSLRPDGIFDYWSPETFVIFDFDPSQGIPTLTQWLAPVQPDGRDLLTRTIDKMFREGVRGDVRYWVDHPKKGKRMMHSTAEPVSENGKVIRLIGNTLDITEQENALEEIRRLKDELYKENIVLREEINSTSMFEEVLGTSAVLQRVLALAAKVAPTDSTVLIAGETGTGKELIARAIHKRSKRGERSFVGVNCAAIPSSLIMSELFGHEKGAFTGAVQRRLGRFELAEGGTLFLDEVGDLPPETQIALLRVLQEREFERVGGTEMLRCDVRVISATNRDLHSAIAAGSFRGDLLYRLNVFPIELPPLRERKEDIPILVNYFVNRYAQRAGKKIDTIRKKSIEALQEYSWPGNVRELQNVIERSLIIVDTNEFSVDKNWLSHEFQSSRRLTSRISTEQEEIEAAL